MKEIKKILVPTDFSEQADAAYNHAQEIAKKFGAKIDLIHIIPTIKYFHESISNMGFPIDMDGDLYPSVQEEAIGKMGEIMKEHIEEEYRGESICKIDRTSAARIVDVANKGGYDLIVMASRGRHATHLLRGSTTEKVIRHSEIPVFTVDARLSKEGVNRILFPTDGSTISFSALPIALSLAETYEAEIVLFHVVELYGSALESDRPDPKKSDEVNIYTTLMKRLSDYLTDEKDSNIEISRREEDFEDKFVVTNGASSRTVHLRTVVAKGVSAHHGIEDYAVDNADIVVMATHGHSGFAHLFLGSTTEKVAQHLTIPVVTVKPDKDKLKKK